METYTVLLCDTVDWRCLGMPVRTSCPQLAYRMHVRESTYCFMLFDLVWWPQKIVDLLWPPNRYVPKTLCYYNSITMCCVKGAVVYIFFGNMIDSTMEETSANSMIPSDSSEERCTPNIPASIFKPMNTRMKAKPFCRWWNVCKMFSIKKNNARSPMMANIFDVKTTNIFCEMLNTAGIESTAKRMSVASTNRTIIKSEVK